MKNRRILLAILSLIIVVLALILLVRPWEPGERGARSVALRDVEDVDRIVLADPYTTTELTKGEGEWYLFGTETVNPVSVENLLIAAGRLEISSITENGVLADTAKSRADVTEVTFYKGERVLLTYSLRAYSGRSLLHPAGSARSYYVDLPGYPGLDLDRVFSATPDHYREHLLIDLRPSEISNIRIQLASGAAFRFTQDLNGDIHCESAGEQTLLPDGKLNELAVRLLFSYFTSIRFEQLAGISADSLSSPEAQEWKLATITVESFSGEHHTLQVFSYHEEPGAEPHLFKAVVLYDNEKDAMFVNYIYLDVLMRGISHYFGEK
jgi:hypothetical protein